jgi:hypothetical protein
MIDQLSEERIALLPGRSGTRFNQWGLLPLYKHP